MNRMQRSVRPSNDTIDESTVALDGFHGPRGHLFDRTGSHPCHDQHDREQGDRGPLVLASIGFFVWADHGWILVPWGRETSYQYPLVFRLRQVASTNRISGSKRALRVPGVPRCPSHIDLGSGRGLVARLDVL